MTNMSSSVPVYLITGARKGLGRALAEHYLAQGALVVGCSRSQTTLTHPNYQHFCLDVADEKAVMSMVRKVKAKLGKVDYLLNNAGIAAMNHLLTTPYSQAQKVFQTNFFGSFLLTREVAKLMMQCKQGSIVNYSTVAVALNLEGEAIYAASKAAIESLTRIAAKELAPMGIRVNAIGPTPIDTDLIRGVPKAKIDALLSQQAIARMGQVSDVINLVDFYNQPQSEFITGQIVYLGGVMCS